MSLEIIVEVRQATELTAFHLEVWRRRDLMLSLMQRGWNDDQLLELDRKLNSGYAVDGDVEYRTFQVGDRRDKISIPKGTKKPRAA